MTRKSARWLLAFSLLMLLILGVSTALAAPSPFTGAWESIDVDGSYQILTIGGGAGSARAVRYYDFGATVCGLDPNGDFLYAASARGTLLEAGNDLSGTVAVYCQTAPPSYQFDFLFTFTYDPATDSLLDNIGVVWTRR